MDQINPFAQLRKAVRQAGRQFRHATDTEHKSIFHPANGFIYGYDVYEVEAALDAFESCLPEDIQTMLADLAPSERLVRDANIICATHPSADARGFAADVLAYVSEQGGFARNTTNPLSLVDSERPPVAEDVLL